MTEKKIQLNFENEEVQRDFEKNYNEFLEKPNVKKILEKANSPEEALEELLKINPDVKPEEARETLKQIKATDSNELSDNDLESVAGGLDGKETAITIATAAIGGIGLGLMAYAGWRTYMTICCSSTGKKYPVDVRINNR